MHLVSKSPFPEPKRHFCYTCGVSQLFLFTGEGTFLMREERRAWQEAFIAKHGPENLLRFDGRELSYRQLLDEISIMPFLAEKRLVIVDGIPRMEKEEMEALPRCIHPACVLLICDPKPDKRLGGVKALLKIATVKEFHPVVGQALRLWIRKRAGLGGSHIDDAAITLLLETVGDDQEMLVREIEKLCVSAGGSVVTSEQVTELSVPSGEQEIWQLSTLIAQGNSAGALRYAKRIIEQGEDPYSLWNVLLWVVRMLVMTHAAILEGERNPARIAGKAEIPFPTARTLLPLAERSSTKNISSLLSWSVEADRLLKTGGYRATGEAPQELLALIDECILRCAVCHGSRLGVATPHTSP